MYQKSDPHMQLYNTRQFPFLFRLLSPSQNITQQHTVKWLQAVHELACKCQIRKLDGRLVTHRRRIHGMERVVIHSSGMLLAHSNLATMEKSKSVITKFESFALIKKRM